MEAGWDLDTCQIEFLQFLIQATVLEFHPCMDNEGPNRILSGRLYLQVQEKRLQGHCWLQRLETLSPTESPLKRVALML